jgi:ribulose kinase
MAQSLSASLAEDLDLPDGYVVQWAAIDPTTGADIAGVVVSQVSIFGTLLGTASGNGSGVVGPYMLVPGPAA